MKLLRLLLLSMTAALRVFAADAAAPAAPAPAALPREWIDPDTGHRVIRLSDTPNSSALYFHQNSYTPEGDKFIFNAPAGIVAVDLTTLGQGEPKLELIVPGASAVEMATRTREVYFTRGGGRRGGAGAGGRRGGAAGAATTPAAPVGQVADLAPSPAQASRGGDPASSSATAAPPAVPPAAGFFAANLDTHAVRTVPNVRGNEINADETFSVTSGNAIDPTGKVTPPPPRVMQPQRERMFGDKIKAGIPLTPDEEYAATKEDGLSRRIPNEASEAFTFTNLKTGVALTTGYQYAWLNHLQFSPTDPNLLLYCHEGTWHEVDRVWVIRTDGTGQRLLHARTMDMEIAGHEFWSHDGTTVWFDLQLPRSKDFWLGGVNVTTGKETRYHLERDWWGVHFNISRDGKLFASDGGDPTQVAFAKDGQWINLLRPQADGSMQREKLVNMAKHNYVTGRGGVEPNLTFTPDGKWIVFTGNFEGAKHVYAVEVAKAAAPKG